MNLGQIRTAVQNRVGIVTSDAFTTTTVLNDFINEALQVYATEAAWPWLEAHETITTVAGTTQYAVAAAWNRTKGVYISGFDPIEWAPQLEIDTITYQGQPRMYTINEEQLDFRPIPDAVYSIIHQYQKNEPALSGDSDTPLLPSAFHYMIVAYAAMLAHQRRHEGDRMASELQNYTQWLRRAKKFQQRSEGPIRIRVRPGAAF